MDPLRNPLDGFSPELYIATLSKLAHSDGLHPREQGLLEYHAARFGVDLCSLPDVPEDLADLPWATRVLVYRDAVMLSQADEPTSTEEREQLSNLAAQMKLSSETAYSISVWVNDYSALLERFDALVGEQD